LHGFTLKLLEDQHVHGPDIVGFSFFSTPPEGNDGSRRNRNRPAEAIVDSPGVERPGHMLADVEDELAFFDDWRRSVAGIGAADTSMMTAADVRKRFPGAERGFAGGLLAPSDGSVERVMTTAKLAEAARRAGARIVTDCAVRGLDLTNGRVSGVFTERGRIAASTVLCAANAWTRLFCGNHGVDIPQIYIIMSMGCTSRSDGPVGAGGQTTWAWRRQIDGAYSLGGLSGVEAPITRDALLQYRRFKPLMKVQPFRPKIRFGRTGWGDLRLVRRWDPTGRSPFERMRVLGGHPDAAIAADSLRQNIEVCPATADGGVAEIWSGALTLTPGDTPSAVTVDSVPGFHVLTGCSYGMSWAPALGKRVADLMTGERPSIDPHPFRLSRFFDDSVLEVHTH
jgi:glycine/D-amino acid oxidase-like deaminating enzyme